MRTAAVTAAFVDAVAAPDARSLAVLGAGLQGTTRYALAKGLVSLGRELSV